MFGRTLRALPRTNFLTRQIASSSWRSGSTSLAGNKFSLTLNKFKKDEKEQQRSIHTSTPQLNAAAATADDTKIQDQSFMDIAKQYGLYPLVGLGAIAAFSKELIFVNPEILLFGNFTLTFFCGYVIAGDSLQKHFEEERAAQREKIDDMMALQVAIWKQAVTQLKAKTSFVPFLEAIKKEEIETMRLASIAQVHKDRHAARNETIKQLTQLRNQEAEEMRGLGEGLLIDAWNYVTDRLENADAQLKDRIFQTSLDALTTGGMDPEKDVTRELYLEFFNSQLEDASSDASAE